MNTASPASWLSHWQALRHVGRARRFVEAANFEAADTEMTHARDLSPDDAGVLLQAGLLALDRGEPEGALSLLSQARAQEPDNPAVPLFQGLARLDLEDGPGARTYLEESLQMAPENRLATGFLAVLAFREEKTQHALDLIKRGGIEASGRLVGRLLIEVERHIAVLDPPPTLPTPRAPEAEVAAGDVTGPAQAARTLVQRVADHTVEPVLAGFLVNRAEGALMRNDAATAARLTQDAVTRYPDVPRGWCLLGVAQLQQKNLDAAMHSLEEAMRRDGPTPDVLFALGCCHHEMGRSDEARDALGRMLAVFEKDAAAYYTLGQIAVREGDRLTARRHFERAASLDFVIVRDRITHLRGLVEAASATP